MQRKVIQIANSTQLISLPRKWTIEHGIKKGDELNIIEEGNKIIITSDKGTILDKIELDITGLDRSSIMYYIRSAYRAGYDEISIKFKNSVTTHFRTNKKMNILSIIHTEVNRLIGVEIIKQTEDFCQVKCISPGTIKEFDTILRRVFLLIKDTNNDLLSAIKNNNYTLLETIEQKHDTITKFISYCLRLLNKYGYPNSKNITPIYHIIASIDKVIDIIKYCSRDVLLFKPKTSKETIKILNMIHNCIETYTNIFYKFENEKIIEFTKTRDEAMKLLRDNIKKISQEEVKILSNMEEIPELLLDLIEAKMSIRY
jgi:phosphate uptake regulator